MKHIVKITGLFFLMLIYSCDYDPISCPNCAQCENFDWGDGFGINVEITHGNIERCNPVFNPNNSSEIIFIKKENTDSTSSSSLVKYNINTGVETTILNNLKLIINPTWSKRGWIVFTGNGLQLYKLKDNGDSLEKITNEFDNIDPCFLDPVNIFFSTMAKSPQGTMLNKVINLNGETVNGFYADDFNGESGIGNSACNSEGLMAGKSSTKDADFFIKTLSIYDRIVTNIIKADNSIVGVAWHTNNDDIFYTTYRTGLFIVNKNTKSQKRLKNACDARSYRALTVSPDGKNIIIERVDAEKIEDKRKIKETSDLYIMDLDGSNERKLF